MIGGPGAVTSVLDDWAACDWTHGVQIDQLAQLEVLFVRTRNTTYEIVVTSAATGTVLVRGGDRFPAFTSARLCGSTAGGSVVKRAGIYPGLRLELESDAGRVITSTIVSVRVDRATSEH